MELLHSAICGVGARQKFRLAAHVDYGQKIEIDRRGRSWRQIGGH